MIFANKSSPFHYDDTKNGGKMDSDTLEMEPFPRQISAVFFFYFCRCRRCLSFPALSLYQNIFRPLFLLLFHFPLYSFSLILSLFLALSIYLFSFLCLSPPSLFLRDRLIFVAQPQEQLTESLWQEMQINIYKQTIAANSKSCRMENIGISKRMMMKIYHGGQFTGNSKLR